MQFNLFEFSRRYSDPQSEASLSLPKVGLIAFVFFSVYAIFPSEAEGDRFTLIVRLLAFGLIALIAIFYGEVQKNGLVWFFFLPVFFIVLVVFSNAPEFSPRMLNLTAIIVLSALVVAFSRSSRGNQVMVSVVNFLLILSAFALFLQIALYVLLGQLVEIHGFVFPWGVSRSAELERFGIARLSGIHTEPGTHAAYSVGLLVVRQLLGRDVFDRIGIVVIASVAATLSFWGLLATFAYFFSYISKLVLLGKVPTRLIYSFGFLFSGLALFVLFSPDYFFEDVLNYFAFRAEVSVAADGSKMVAWAMGLKNLNEIAFLGLPIGTDYCNGCASPQDAGIVLNFALYLGLLAAICYCVIFVAAAVRMGGWSFVPFGLLFLFAKFFYFDPIVWLAFFLSVSCISQRSKFSHISSN